MGSITMKPTTPLKFNMEPEKKSLEKVIPFGNPSFSGSMLNFGGVPVRSEHIFVVTFAMHRKFQQIQDPQTSLA